MSFMFTFNFMSKAEEVYNKLIDEFGFKDATGKIKFTLKNISITVKQKNVVGNIIEEWFDKWLTKQKIKHIYNVGQSSPDFWLDPKDKTKDWLEVKAFYESPNFDVAQFRSFINLVIEKPYKLQSDYIIIEYESEDGIVSIKNCWFKKIWEICCASEKWPLRLQIKNKVINNIRPAIWYSEKTDFPTFKSLEHFLAAVEEVIFNYPDTHPLASTWKENLVDSYKNFYGVELDIPRWNDIKEQYVLKKK